MNCHLSMLVYVYLCIMHTQGGGRALLTEDEIQEGVYEMNQKADYDYSGMPCPTELLNHFIITVYVHI